MLYKTNYRTISIIAFMTAFAHFAPAMAQEAAIPSSEVEVVIVTAQHRKERGQDVPISITSVSGKAIENSGYKDVTDLQNLVPGVQYDPTQGAAFQIRGVGTTSFDFANAKSVNVVVDEVVMDAQRANGLIGLQDIASVDVLMGPQGTLFGKNSTSGAIIINTKNPDTEALSSKLNLSYGSRDDYGANLMLNLPISEQAALRISTFAQGQGGYGRFTVLNRDLGELQEYGTRLKFLYRPSDSLEIILSGDYGRHHDSFIRTSVDAGASLNALQKLYGVTPGVENADSADTSLGGINTSEWGSSLRANYKIGEHTVSLISAYRGSIYDNRTPADLLPTSVFAYVPFNHGYLETKKFSQELRLTSPTGKFLEYVAGVFYNRLEAQQVQYQWATLGAPLPAAGSSATYILYNLTGAAGSSGNASQFNTVHTSQAAYGQLKFNFTPKFNLSIGGRYTDDKNSQGLSYVMVDGRTITGIANPYFYPTNSAPAYNYGEIAGDNFSYKISPQYRINPNVMLYASYSTGYKPGGVAFVGSKYSPFKKETVEAYEVGVKSEIFNRRLRLNFDIFNSDFTDFQTTILTSIPDGKGGTMQTTTIGNAGGLRSQGAELTFNYRPISELTLSGGLTYTKAWYTDYVYNTTTDYTGSRLSNAPRFQGSIAADYRHAFANQWGIIGHIDYGFRTKTWTVVGQPAYSEVEGYGLVNGRFTITPPNSKLNFGVYGRNLADTYFSPGWQQYGALGLVHYTTPNAYRTVGIFANFEY